MPERRFEHRSRISLGVRWFALSLPFLILLVGIVAASQQSGAEPKLTFSHDYWYFGYMPVEAIVQHSYWIRNTGTDTLRIGKVTPGCGCTTAPLSKNSVAPGDSARLDIVFDTKNMIGKMVKDVEILSNDPEKPKTKVSFLAVVNREHPLVRAKSSTLRFAPTSMNKGQLKKKLEIVNNYDSEISVKLVDYPSIYFKVAPQALRIGARSTGVIEVEQTSIVKDERDILSSLTLEFAGSDTDRVTVPLVSYYKK
jgi:hypothetical protein